MEKIVLGSGKLYVTEATKSGNAYTIPDDATLETEANILGYIKGGATIVYTPTYYTAIDDLGLKSKKITTSEEAHFQSGVMTWNGETLAKLCSRATVTTDTSKKTRTVKIGGGTDDGKNYVIRFVHHDKEDGDIRVTIVGSNTAGFSFAFAKEAETVINVDFTAVPCDATGTLITYTESTGA